MPRIEIRPAVSADIIELISLDHTCRSNYVWQMDRSFDDGQFVISFREIRLPRPIQVVYPRQVELLENEWQYVVGVINGTDASRVFFIYEGTNDLFFGEGALKGNLVAPNAAVLLTAVQGFEGSVISGGGLRVRGSGQGLTFQHTAAIPESTVFGLIAVAGGGAILIHRFFKVRQAGG